MAIYQIPIRFKDTQRAILQYITLDNVRVGMEFRHSFLEDCWYLWLRRTNSVLLVGPIKIASGFDDLLSAYHYMPAVPPGRLYVGGIENIDINLENVDTSNPLYYESLI